MSFPFNQPDKTRDCGYRCLYHVLRPVQSYEKWLDAFRFFDPVKNGITFSDVCAVLNYHKVEHHFTQLSETGKFIVYSGVWLKPEGRNHGHYFIYHDGSVYCSTKSSSYRMALASVVARLEAKTIEGAFRCLKILN